MSEGDGRMYELAEPLGHRLQAELKIYLALRSSKMTAENDLCAAFTQELDRGEGGADSGVVGDDAAIDRHVEINADKHPFSFDLGIADRSLWHRPSPLSWFRERKQADCSARLSVSALRDESLTRFPGCLLHK